MTALEETNPIDEEGAMLLHKPMAPATRPALLARIRSARGSAATIRAPSAIRRPGLSSRAWRRETAKNKAALAAPEERVSPSRLIPSP